MQWVKVVNAVVKVGRTGESAPKKAKTVLSARKVMTTVFWDSQGIILIDYLDKGKNMTGTYYASLLKRLKAELQKSATIGA